MGEGLLVLIVIVSLAAWAFMRFARPKGRRVIRYIGDGSFAENIVGESNYQAELESFVGRSEDGAEFMIDAWLVPEPDNRHDRKAIRVDIMGRTVGYIPRDATSYYHAGLKGGRGRCRAMIVGGWDRGSRGKGSFGVKLDVKSRTLFEVIS